MPEQPRPSYAAAGVATLAVFALYLATLAPTTSVWDTSEYITAAYTLGLPHPPGNPLFVLIGHLFTLLPIGASPAARVNLLAALCSAVTAGFWFLIAERVVSRWLPARWQHLTAGGLAALLGATAFTVWNQSVVNEKVYMLSLVFFAVVSWVTVLWCDDPDAPGADRLLVLIAFLLGLGYTNHPAGLLAGPAVAAAVLARRARTVLNWRLVTRGVFAFALGLSVFAFEPIRAGHHPSLNEGDPTGCVTEFAWSCTFSSVTEQRLAANINRDQYGKPALSQRQAPFTAQLGMWWLYFKWQWIRDWAGQHAALQSALAAVFLILGLYGGVLHYRHERRSFWFFGPLMGTVTVALVFYMNFKYGWSQAPQLQGVAREVRDRDYFYVWSFSAWGVWAALGLVGLWATLAELAARRPEGASAGGGLPGRAWVLAAPVLGLALVPLAGNWQAATHRGDTFVRDMAVDLLNSVEPYGILIVGGDNDTFPLWYAQQVEGIRRDVTVAIPELLNTDWYVRGLIRRPNYPYDAARGPAMFRNRAWPQPDGPVIKMSVADADAVPAYEVIDHTMQFRKDSLVATIDPRNLPGDGHSGYLTRGDLFVLRMIADSSPRRPVYIGRTTGGYGRPLGFGPYLVGQGLVERLALAPIHANRDTLAVQGAGYLDVARSAALWQNYRAPDSLLRRGRWVDGASVDLPGAYVFTGQLLAAGLAAEGDTTRARAVMNRAGAIANAAGLTAPQ
jgi:hypothetical protein